MNGNTIENTGTIVTGGKAITLQNATVNGGTLDGANGALQLNGATVNNGTLTGNLLAYGDTSTLNHVAVDENGTLDLQAHAIAQGTISIDGTITVQNNRWLYNESAEDVVALSGTGMLNLSGDGTSGYLGTAKNRGSFTIGKDLTVTTRGFSIGYIYANLTNAGIITTTAGDLSLNGNTIENIGSIVTGGKAITLQNATVNGGTLDGANGFLRLNGATINNGTLTGNLLASGETSALNHVTVDENGTLDLQAHAIAQGTISIDGTVTVQNNKWLYNASTTREAVSLTGTGTLNLSGDGTTGNLGSEEYRGGFDIGKDLTITTLGFSIGYIYANLTNEGTITTKAGDLMFDGNTIENTGSIVTGGKAITLRNATVSGVGTLNGANGELQLNGTTVNYGTLTGKLGTYGNTSTLKQVTVDENGTLDIQAHAIAQGTISIDGTVTVQNNKWLYNASTTREAVSLSGTGTLNLSGNGTSGNLGTEEYRGAFAIGKDLTVTTLGYSTGYIYANLTNEGTITTKAGDLTLNGNTIENTGAIVTGGRRAITLTGTNVSGDGVLNGKQGTVYLNNSTLTGAILKGQVQATGGKSTLKNVTLDVGGTFTANAYVSLQDSFTIDGTVSVQNNIHLLNESADTPVALSGIGTLNLSGDGTCGNLGSAENRGAFTIGKDLTITTFGYSTGYIYANVVNEGTITTKAGDLTLSGCTIENAGSIITGGKTISLQNATVNGIGTLNGANGELLLNGATVNNGTLTGKLRTYGNTNTLNQVTVDENGTLDIQTHAIAQGTISIDGMVTVQNNRGLYNESAEETVALSGTGTLNLSGNGTTGNLGSAENRGAFTIGKDLTVTTLGYSFGYIYANVTNQGEITTSKGELVISGVKDTPLAFRNSGNIRGGDKAITFTHVTMDNTGGSLFGGHSTVYLNTGTTVTGGKLGGMLQVSGGASVLLDEHDCIQDGKINVTGNSTFTARNLIAQADFNVDYSGSLELSNVTLVGTINAYENPKQVTIAGVSGVFELVLSPNYANRYSILGNDFTNAIVTIRGNGNIDLSGNYWGGLTDEDEIRARFGLGANVNVSNALTTAPEGKGFFLTGVDLANEKYLSLAQENLKLTFLSKLDPQSITEETIQLWDETANQQVSLAGRLPSVQDNQLLFDNELFVDGHAYRLVLSDAIQSLDGSALNTEFRGAVAFTVDRTAPKVLNVEKTVNLTGKLPDFRITFSSEIDASTLSKALKVTSPEGQNVNVEIAMLTDRVALVTSKDAINVPGEYTVSIDADTTTDKAGNHLQESFEGTIEMTRINLDIMDLASSKTSVAQGETFTVQWKTFNQEDAELYGRWTDGVYLSKDNIWDNSDTLLASVVHYNGLPQGSSVDGRTQVALSGVVDGDYYLLVRPDIYNEKPTGASERNVESIAISVSTNPLPDGERIIHSGQSSTYKFTAEAGASYKLMLDTLRDDYSGMELYIGYGYAPTRERYDTAMRNANDALLALASQNYEQDIYVMVYAKNSGSNIAYTLTAEKAGLDITSVTPNIQSVLGEQALTFVVEGLCFTPDTTIAAVNADEIATDGVVTYINDHQLLLTFEPGQLEAGDYVLKATDGAVSVLSDAVTLTAEGAPNLVVTADLPQRIGNHLITNFDVNYANTGNASMSALLLTVSIYEVDKDGNKGRSVGIMGINKSTDQNHRAYNGSYNVLPTDYVSTATIYAQGKVPGQLEAGASGSVNIDLIGLLQPWNISGNNNLLWEINYFDEYSTEALDWQEFMPGNSDEFYLAMENAVGTTWGDYVKMLQTNAQTLLSVGADASDANDLLQLTIQSVSGNINPYSVIEGIEDLNVATVGSLQLSFERFYSNRMDDQGWHTNWEYSLQMEGNDAVTFFSPEQGVFTFRKNAYGKFFCENDSSLTLTFRGSQAILQSPDYERTWTMEQVDARNWRLAQVSDTLGNSIRLTYDNDGNLSKLTSSDGEFILVTKDDLTASNGLEVTYQRSVDGHLTGVSYNDGRKPLTYQYDGDALTGVSQGGTLVSSYIYDESGSVVQATKGNLIKTVTTEQPGVITVTDNCGHSFTAVYYADGNLAKLTDNVSGNWNYYTYDANGWLQTISNSAGLSESYVSNANGDLLRFTDIYGNTSAYTYFQGHLKTAENATGYAVNISYDQAWNLTEVICNDGSVISFSYDDNGNLTSITNPLGNSMTYVYDDSQHVSHVTYGDYSFDLSYDDFGNIASVTQNGHTTAYEYNASGWLTSLTDANGNRAQMTYDGNDKLTEAVFADGSKQTWGYNTVGDMVSTTTRAGDVIGYTWSADGTLLSTAIAGNQYEYAYNNEGSLTAASDAAANRNLGFEYDTHGYLTGLTYQDGTAIAITQNTTGNLASYSIAGQTFAYTYQGGEMSSVSVNGNAFTTYTRNAEGNLTEGNGIAYEYDALNNITRVGDTEYTYNSSLQIIQKSTDEGIWTYTYDRDGNLASEMLDDGTALHYTYSYDGAGNRLARNDMVTGGSTTWTYGSMNQILTVKAGEAEAVEYTYDLNGNLLSDGHAAYTWTEDSRMASMTVDGTTWTYTYNALGYRDSASDGVDTFTFYYDGTGNLLAQFKNGEAYQFYIRGATGIEGYVDADGAIYTFTYDLGGNVTAVVGTNGKSATYVYDAFGNIIEQAGDITDNALTWHGHFGTLLNPDGSYYVLARNYSATDGRFISTDPSWFNDGANLYTYAYNDPVNYLDLNGMAGQGTSLPTKHEEGSFLDNLASGKWLENLLPGMKDYDPTDPANQVQTNAPKIGTGDAPNGWFNAANAVVDKAVPSQYNKVSDYYKGGLNVAKTLYEKGCVSTKDGTVWPSRFATELDDRYMRHCFDRYQQATTQSGKEEFIRQAYIRYYDLQDQRKANSSKPKGGTNATSANTQSASSYDPNDKLSTAGATELHFVQNGSRLQYTVLFENDPDNATAPARKVYIRDVMDDNLDINTFQLHGFTLAGHAYQLPEGRDSFNGNVVLDLGDAEITVAVAINIDSETRELIASFTAIDPETGFELQDLTKGVLLVNDESGRGEGNLSYSIQALPDLPTDAQIHNTAEIFFDFNDPIETPTTLNTIDADAPGAASLVLSADASQITLVMSAEDIGAGVEGYNIRWSTDGEHFSDYGYTTYTQLQLPGRAGVTYYFQIQAVDAVGLTSEWSEIQSLTIIGTPTELEGDAMGLSWKAVEGAESYVVEYSTDAFEHFVRIQVIGTSLDSFSLPQASYQWRVRAAESDDWEYGEEIVAPEQVQTPQLVQSNEDGALDLFFAHKYDTWNGNYHATHMGTLNSWNGTDETSPLDGKNMITDVFHGSTDRNLLYLTDDANGDALFVDDIYSELPGTLEEQQARVARINEIRAGLGNDIIDLTSQRFDYVGNGMTVRGGLGDDVIWANTGNNWLFGDAGNDRIVGASGDDVIVGGAGNDSMHGGGGDDIFAFGGNWGQDTVEQLADGKVTLWFKDGDETKWNDQTLTYIDGDNSVKVSGVALENINLKFGDDNGNAIERNAELSAAGAFDDFTSEKIFEDRNKGMLA